MPILCLQLILLASFVQEELKPGEKISSVIEPEDVVTTTEKINKSRLTDQTLGKRYLLDGLAPGFYTCYMRSQYLDSYLILRNHRGEALAENNNGYYYWHSRLVIILEPKARGYILEACSLSGGLGPFELTLHKGVKPELKPSEQKAAFLKDVEEMERSFEKLEKSPLVANMLNSTGVKLRRMNEHEKAQRFMMRGLAIREGIFGSDHLDVASSLNSLALLHFDTSEFIISEGYFKRALAIQEKILGPDHPDLATTLNNLAVVYRNTFKPKKAVTLLERALTIRVKELGEEHPNVAISINNLAVFYQTYGLYDKAEAMYKRTLKIYENTLAPDDPQIALCLYNLGMHFIDLSDYEKAEPLLKRSLTIRKKKLKANHPDLATSFYGLAKLNYFIGDYARAESQLKKALKIQEISLVAGHPELATTLNSLAMLYTVLGDGVKAKPLYERALKIREEALPPNHPHIALSLSNLAVLLYADFNMFEEAEPLLKRALAIYEKELGQGHPEVAKTLNYLGGLYRGMGEYAKAEPYLKRALAVFEAALGKKHPYIGVNLYNLALLYYAMGEYARAKPLLERSLMIQENTLGAHYPYLGFILNSMVLVHLDLGEYKKAWQLSQRAAEALDAHQNQLLWSLTEDERMLYAGQKKMTLELVISLALKLSTKEVEQYAFETLLSWKGRVSHSLLQSRELLMRNMNPEARNLLTQLKTTQSALSKELHTTDKINPRLNLTRISRLQKKSRDLEAGLHQHAGMTDQNIEIQSLKAIQAAMPSDGILLDYYVHRVYQPAEPDKDNKHGLWAAPSLSVWILDKNKVQHLDLGPAKRVREAVQAFLKEQKANNALRDLLWAPIAPLLEEENTVFVSPDSFLGAFPMETLRMDDGKYLIENHSFIYLQNKSFLAPSEDRRPVRDNPSLLVVGAVDYGAKGEEKDHWIPLPGTLTELKAIHGMHKALFNDRVGRLVLRGTEAMEARIKEELPRYSMAHIATHGFFKPNQLLSIWERFKDNGGVSSMKPLIKRNLAGALPGFLSGLVFSGANLGAMEKQEDGFLTAEEILWLDLSKVNLAVLSACETGLGSPTSGEGMLGLGRAPGA